MVDCLSTSLLPLEGLAPGPLPTMRAKKVAVGAKMRANTFFEPFLWGLGSCLRFSCVRQRL